MKRLGIFGGTFNPIHNGHINSMKTVAKALDLDCIHVVPAYKSPMRGNIHGASPEERLEMVQLGLRGTNDQFTIDREELERGGISYTIDTLKSFTKAYDYDELYLIVGVDQFESFDQWKDYKDLLSMANLVVTSRPGGCLPGNIESMPKGIANLVEKFVSFKAQLKTGRSIYFIQLEDVDVSASEIRKRLRVGESVSELVPRAVEEYIFDKHLYKTTKGQLENYEDLAKSCANILFSKKGINVKAFDLREVSQPCEFAVIASGTSRKHASALASHVVKEISKQFSIKPQNIEGQSEGAWILLDYGALIVHVFYDYTRLEYKIEELWKDGHDMGLQDPYLEK